MDSTYADLAQQVLRESRTDESRCANYEFPEEIPIENLEEKNSRVQKVVSYARWVWDSFLKTVPQCVVVQSLVHAMGPFPEIQRTRKPFHESFCQ